jgi:hypothetical protein
VRLDQLESSPGRAGARLAEKAFAVDTRKQFLNIGKR